MIADPEIFREWQYARYMEPYGAQEEDTLDCALCGEAIPPAFPDELRYGKYVCRQCVECEAGETGCGLGQAMANLAERFGL